MDGNLLDRCLIEYAFKPHLDMVLFSHYLAGAILCWLKCVESTHYGGGLNFQPTQPEARIKASSNIPSRQIHLPLERQRGCHYDNPFQYCAISTAAEFVFSLHSVLLFH